MGKLPFQEMFQGLKPQCQWLETEVSTPLKLRFQAMETVVSST